MKRTPTNVLCIPWCSMHQVTWSRLGMESNFSGHILILKRKNYFSILPPDPNEWCPKFFQRRKILSNLSRNAPQHEIRTITHAIIARWRENDARVTQEWHNGDTRVTLDNDTRVTQRWRMSDARVTLGWHNSDATVTHEWRYSDARVTQQWHNGDTTVPSAKKIPKLFGI